MKPAPSRPEDFVPIVLKYCVPVVKKIKEYRRDHGVWPGTMHDIDPTYTYSFNDQPYIFWGLTDKDARISYFECFTKLRERIRYDFTPGQEKWSVSGPFVTGDIPAPPVEIYHPTQPTSNEVKQ